MVITALETTLSLPEGSRDIERRILAQNDAMSAPTVLFVLAQVLRQGTCGSVLAMALGPGFTRFVLPITMHYHRGSCRIPQAPKATTSSAVRA